MKISNITWDIDTKLYKGTGLVLPTSVDIPDNINPGKIADYLSDNYGFCVLNYSV